MNPLARAVLRIRASTAAALTRVARAVRGDHAATGGRRVRQFAGARTDRLTADLFSGRTSGAGDQRFALTKLRNRSRTLVRDTPEAKRYCALFEENVVGHAGILLKPAALLRDGSGNPDTALNDAVLEAWERWGEAAHCSLDGTLGWVDLQQLVQRLEPMDGEYLVLLHRGRGAFGLQLQVLDPDQLDETLNVESWGASGGPWIRQGVEMDPATGRPVAYHIWDGHPSDTNRGARKRIPADRVIHGFDPWRPGATRGVPWLHAAIQSINMISGYDEATLVAARIAASAMGTIEGTADGDPGEEADAAAANDTPQEFEPGRWWKLAPGEKATMLDPKHPTTSYADFRKAHVRAIAQSGGVSYTSLSGDLEAVNYSSIRAGLLSERDRYRMLQGRLIRALHTRVYRAWLPMAQLTGALRISAQDVARAERVRWQPRGFPWVDPRADIEALRAEIRLGINSRTEAAAERGRDLEKVLEQIDAEERLAQSYGVDVSGVDLPPQVADPAETKPAKSTTTPPERGLRIS